MLVIRTLAAMVLVSLASVLCAQRNDTLDGMTSISQHPFKMIYENIPSSKFLGNSWHIGLAGHVATHTALSLEAGRTYGTLFTSPAAINFRMVTWGVSYSRYHQGDWNNQLIGAFSEWSNFYLPPATLRADYLFDPQRQAHYLRPSAGFSFLLFDLMYGYNFMLTGENAMFKGMFSLRFKLYPCKKNWMHIYPLFED